MDANVIFDSAIKAVLGRAMVFPTDYCATFAAGIIRQVHGVDVLGNRFGGQWAETEDEAYRQHPMGLLVTVARRMRELGWRRVEPLSTRPGDLVVIRAANYGHAIGVALGNTWALRRFGSGVRYEPHTAIVAAWTPQGTA